MAEGFLVVDQQLIEESIAGIETVAENDVAEFVCDHGCQAGLIRQHVDQPAAEDDGVTDGEGLQRGGHHHAAAYFRVNINVVGDLQVVDHRLQDLVDFAARRHQADALQAIDNVIFRLAVPGTLGLNGGKVIGRLGIVLHRGLHQDLAQFLFLAGVTDVVAPQPGLRFEVQFLGQRVVQISFLAVHERRHPLARLHIGAPAVEVEVPAGVPAATVSAVKSNNVVVLIFDPDAAKEPALAGLILRRHVEHQATHFAEEFAAHVIELVVLLVEAIRIDEDHLQEAVRQELHGEREEVANGTKNLLALAVDVRQGNQRHTL